MRSILQQKKGQLNTLTGSILAVTMAIIVFVFGLSVLGSLQSTQSGATASNTTKAIGQFAGFNDYWSLIILAVVIGVVFGLIFWAFRGGNMR